MVNLALGSSERVLRSREPNFVLERSIFDEVLVLRSHRTQTPDAVEPLLAPPVSADLGQRIPVSRVRHRTHAPDSPGCVRSRTKSDEDITPLDAQDDPTLDIQGPITTARARQLNLQVSSFLSNSLYDFENRLLPNDYIVLRNHGEDQGMYKGWLGGVENQQGRQSQGGGPNRVDFEPVSESRTSEE